MHFFLLVPTAGLYGQLWNFAIICLFFLSTIMMNSADVLFVMLGDLFVAKLSNVICLSLLSD